MAKKAASKKKPKDGSDMNALGLKGPGVEVPRISALTKAINEYEVIKDQRCALTTKEVPAKQKVITLMDAHADKLRNPKTGTLMYPLDDKRFVEIEPAKVKIKFHSEKPQKPKKQKADSGELEPEQQQARDQQD